MKCLGCGRKLNHDDIHGVATSGTGYCSHCAAARVANARRDPAVRRWLEEWRARLDGLGDAVLPLTMQ